MPDLSDILQIIRLQDNGLIEIYVDHVGLAEWNSVAFGLQSISSSVIYQIDASDQPFDSVGAHMFETDCNGRYSIAFQIGRQTWTTGFYSADQIDLQGDPREVQDERDVGNVIDLLDRLHRITGKTACLYAEGGRDMVSTPPIICMPDSSR